MPGICTANTSPNNCGHRILTVNLDGEPLEFHVHNADLDAMPWTADEKRQLILLAAKRARVNGLSMVDALNRVFVGAEATNVKQYALLMKDVTKTNLGTSYANIPAGANGERSLVEFTGCTQFRAVMNANLISNGTQVRIVRDSDNTVFYESPTINQTGERELDTDWQSIPNGFTGMELLRVQAKCANNTDDPIFRRCILLVR